MRLAATAWLLVHAVSFAGCASAGRPEPQPWSTGFWFWEGSAADPEQSPGPVDALFVQAVYLRRDDTGPWPPPPGAEARWMVHGHLPEELPAAREYWLVWRYERQAVPDLRVAAPLAREFTRLAAEARGQRLRVAGWQLDVDAPTAALPQYAAFLRAVRKDLPPGSEISITALLDWFRPGTAIGEVVRQVDEFVPQFYDVENRDAYSGGAAIAAPVDAARWGPAFRRPGKRFRVGISVFGRARMAPRAQPAQGRYPALMFFGDLAPLDLAANPAFAMQAAHNPAGEVVVSYRTRQHVRIGYNNFKPGDGVEFIMATPESVRAAVESARRMGAAGVVFFRWPSGNESVTMQPGEALAAAGAAPPDAAAGARVHAVDGRCAAVKCVDLYLEGAAPLSAKEARYAIRTSVDLEYFVPERNVPVRMTGPSRLEVRVPPYCGRSRLYLGRAVSLERCAFTVEEEP